MADEFLTFFVHGLGVGIIVGAGIVVVAKVNTEESPELANRNGVRVIPTFVRFDGGKETARHRGADQAANIAAVLKIGRAA